VRYITFTYWSDHHQRAINEFGDRNNVPPSRIVFFRDGLSEGEYNIVGKEEIDDIGGE